MHGAPVHLLGAKASEAEVSHTHFVDHGQVPDSVDAVVVDIVPLIEPLLILTKVLHVLIQIELSTTVDVCMKYTSARTES